MKLNPIPSTLTTVGDSNVMTMTSRVDPAGAERMMSMLVNLYADQKLAVVREYTANGVDASRISHATVPVNITTPTKLEPNLVITDRGTGMTMQEVEMTYLAFAASSKRDSNDQIGGLGVGAKSAWAISESFLIDTVKNGFRTVVRAARDLKHQVLMAGQPTDLPNGTTISIPVSLGHGDEEKWQKVIQQVSTAHDPGAVTVDGKPVASIAGGPNRIGPVICHRANTDRYGSSVHIRSGGTLFEAGDDISYDVRRKLQLQGCVIELPIGSFDHTPSRESLIASDRTKAVIKAALGEYEVAYQQIAAQISQLSKTDIGAAVKLRNATLGDVGRYDILPIKAMLKVPNGIGAWNSGRKWLRTDTKSDSSGEDTINATSLPDALKHTVIVTDVPAGRKLRNFIKYVKDNHWAIQRVIPIPSGQTSIDLLVVDGSTPLADQKLTLDKSMVPAENVYTWERWQEVTAPTRTGSRGPNSGYSCQVTHADGSQPVDRELTAEQILALNLPVWYVDELQPYIEVAKFASVGVILGRRKEEPLLRAIPGAMSLYQFHTTMFKKAMLSWSRDVKLALLAGQQDLISSLKVIVKARDKRVAAGKSSHPALDKAAVIVAADSALTSAQRSTYKAMKNARHHGSGLGEAIVNEIDQLNLDLKKAWPLIEEMNSRHHGGVRNADAFIDYIVAVDPR